MQAAASSCRLSLKDPKDLKDTSDSKDLSLRSLVSLLSFQSPSGPLSTTGAVQISSLFLPRRSVQAGKKIPA